MYLNAHNAVTDGHKTLWYVSYVVSNYMLLWAVAHRPPLTLSLCVGLSAAGISGSE